MAVIKKLPKDEYTCYMCKEYCFIKHKYIYQTFDFSPERPSLEFEICPKWAIRESKYKKLDQLDKFLAKGKA